MRGGTGRVPRLLVVAHSPLVARFLLAAMLAVALNAHADITGKVVAVADCDTITVLNDRTQIKVRRDGEHGWIGR